MGEILEKLIPYIMAVSVGAAGAWFVADKTFTAEISSQKTDYTSKLKSVSDSAADQANKSLVKINDLQQQISKIDAEKTQQINSAQDANNSLRRDVANGTKRVRIAEGKLATCAKSGSGLSGASGVVNATGVELTTEAGQSVLDLRSAIISDTAKIEYLQDYIAELQKKGIIAGAN